MGVLQCYRPNPHQSPNRTTCGCDDATLAREVAVRVVRTSIGSADGPPAVSCRIGEDQEEADPMRAGLAAKCGGRATGPGVPGASDSRGPSTTTRQAVAANRTTADQRNIP